MEGADYMVLHVHAHDPTDTFSYLDQLLMKCVKVQTVVGLLLLRTSFSFLIRRIMPP